MISMIWVVLFLALTGSQCGYGLPVRPTPQDYPHDGRTVFEGWASEGGLYAAVPALALVVTAIVLVFGCTWCYRHKDCKLFTASAQQLHAAAAQRVQPPDSGFSEPANNNISEDNNNGPISLREMQNIANNNAAAYIVSENEERNRVSRESVVEFEPLPTAIIGVDPLERCADWFGEEDFPRNNLQYLREIGRGWFGRVVEGEIEDAGASTNVAVQILNQNATLEDKARFLDEAKMYRDITHENILAFIGKCLQEDPWILMFELCTMDLQQYLIVNRPKMAILNENGVPLQLMCDITSALAYLHSRGYTYGRLWGGSVLVRGQEGEARAVLGRYSDAEPQHDCFAPEVRQGALYATSSEIWSLGTLIWEVCSWGAVPTGRPSPPPDLPCPYKSHLYQVMQLCWNGDPTARPTAAQVHALISHLHATHAAERAQPQDHAHFEERWQRLKPNTIPKLDEHVAIVHAPSTNARFNDFDHNTLGVAASAAGSRSSSIMSDRDPPVLHVKSESLTNLHGSLDDVRNIYLTHNETAALECHQGNIHLEDSREKDQDRSDASMDPWLKDIIAGSQDDVSYYKDVSDVIKNLDNILNSEKTSSSESSHQASPSRDNLSLDCKKEYPMQSSLVKSPGITNFQNILDTGFGANAEGGEPCVDEEVDRDTIGTLSHSFERHSDSTSQHTLENLTPDTPMRDLEVFIEIERQATDAEVSEIESQIKSPEALAEVEIKVKPIVDVTEIKTVNPVEIDTELPKKVIESNVPELKELCAASMPSVSDNERSPRKDCQTPCDIVTEKRTEDETKSIDDVREVAPDSTPLEVIEVTDSVDEQDVQEAILPASADETTISNEAFDTLPSVTEDVSTTTQENDTSLVKLEDIGPESIDSEYNYSKDETILVSDLVDTVTDSSKDEPKNQDEGMKVDVKVDLEPVTPKQMPVSVQNKTDEVPCQEPADLKQSQKADSKIIEHIEVTPTHLPPEIVQNTDRDAPVPDTENLVRKEVVEEKIENVDNKESEVNKIPRSDSLVVDIKERSDDSTEYMDLINNTNSQILNDSIVDNSVKEVELKENSGAETSLPVDDSGLSKNDSTQYLDLPSFDMIKRTRDFLQMEITNNSKHVEWNLVASTPMGSDNSCEMLDSIDTVNEDDTMVMSKTKVAQCEPGTTAEVKCAPDAMSPFESPSHKSHQTDTYDENSSVVLGPFENCTELFKGMKPNIDPVELPREELLAFSSNFSEMNLETPSPLRDGNFLNEVPDITLDAEHFDDIASVGEPKDVAEAPSDDTESGSGTQKRVSPSTPPNSPGISLASTSQQKYIVDIDLSEDNAPEPDSSIRSIDLNQIELQITSKLAMAENENNMNIEYSGPLTVEGLIEEGGGMPESDAVPEYYLAGNGGSAEDVRELLSLDEECVKALRNELELKLPLAQVAAIEPAEDGEAEGEAGWGAELPPPPELVVSYPGALSPIQEETAPQLSAYENDTHWNPSTRTESSESYPEPCNNSTDSATSLPRGDTYTVPSKELTHTLNPAAPDVHHASSMEITMSADSLNGSPYKSHAGAADPLSPVDDHTYTKEEHESSCERISQESPFLVSPTTDTDTDADADADADTDAGDKATRVSSLSRTTLPTDAKLSKPTDTQGLSKATSIDSWCSNDTLYNLEENFDDLAMDAELAGPCDPRDEGNSDSTDTLTHNDDDREASRCSTYLVHESRSEPCDTFSPDSIAADDRTYTKTKPEAPVTPSGNTDIEDSAKNTQTKDLAYGTLMSGLPSFSNCSVEAAGAEDAWRLPQPELVRRSPAPDLELSPPKPNERDGDKPCEDGSSLPLATDRRLSKMDSIDVSCLQETTIDGPHGSATENRNRIVTDDSPHYTDIVPSLTSTPIVEPTSDLADAVAVPLVLPGIESSTSENFTNVPNFETFQGSVDVMSLDVDSRASSHQESEALLEEKNATLSWNRDSLPAPPNSTTHSRVENSDARQPEEPSSREKPSRSMESSNISDEFRIFENSLRSRPQDLCSLSEGSSQLLYGGRMLGELTARSDRTSHSSTNTNEPMQSLDISPPSITNLIESHELVDTREPSTAFLINFDMEDETEQPHSIIVTEVPTSSIRMSPNRSSESHVEANLLDINHTYHSHDNRNNVLEQRKLIFDLDKTNGEQDEQPECLLVLEKSREIDDGSNSNHNITLGSDEIEKEPAIDISNDKPLSQSPKDLLNGSTELPETEAVQNVSKEILVNGSSEKYATLNFLNETFEELIESSVDDSDSKDDKLIIDESPSIPDTTPEPTPDLEEIIASPMKDEPLELSKDSSTRSMNSQEEQVKPNGVMAVEGKITTMTEDFLQNEKKFATFDSYLPLLSDIRFTGPASEMMSTSFQDSPTSPTSPECEQDSKPNTAAEILKDWDSDSDSHSSNSSSGEFIWKDGEGHETSLVPSTHFDHQRGSSGPAPGGNEGPGADGGVSGASEGSGDSGSGSEGDEVEFVPSSWDCRAAPAKSSLRSLEQATPESKKRVVFKRQKYHCVYEYPREAADAAPHSPAYLPDLSTYCEWDPTSAEEAELCYGQLFSSPSALGAHYPLRAGGPFGPDYDEDFFISSSARPFESLGIMSTTSQFFPGGIAGKRALLERSLSDEGEFPAPPSPPATTLDFTTPDSGVEDITPGSTLDDDFEPKKAEPEAPWRPLDSGSSSESVSPSSPGGGGELGGLRHTRDRLKLDLPPSPHAPSPRHARVFNFALAPPKRRPEGAPAPAPPTPLVMSDETPVARAALPAPEEDAAPQPEPTFSTFGKSAPRLEPAQKLILTDEGADADADAGAGADGPGDPAKGEGTVLDSGDEDSGIESSSKATLERNAPNVS